MLERFNNWVKRNKIQLQQDFLEDNINSIKGFGNFLLLSEKEIIIDKDFNLVLTEKEQISIQNNRIEFVVFLFGGQYYYSKVNLELEDKQGNLIVPCVLIDFKYLGEAENKNKIIFNHLGVHDEYELLSGSHSAKAWCQKAIFLGHKSLGIVDKNSLAGTLPFQISCTEKGIKPILGETVTILYDENTENEKYDVKLYVKNEEGWKNLLRINKEINVINEGFIKEKQFLEFGTGLILVLFKESFLNKSYVKLLKKCFDEVYFQMDSVKYENLEFEKRHLFSIKQYLEEFADTIEPVLINDSYYLEPEEYESRLSLGKLAGEFRPYSKNEHYKDVEESVRNLIDYFPEGKKYNDLEGEQILELAINNVNKIVEECNFKIQLGIPKLPLFPYEGDKTELFDYLIQDGWRKKILGKVEKSKLKEYKERMQYERDFILRLGFLDYFLINFDIISWAKSNKIRVGNARGSVAGSLVAFLIDITTVDPIKYDLLFERFLNETRGTLEKRLIVELDDGRKFNIPEKDFEFLKEGKELTKEDFKSLSQYQV